jgi:ABC-type transporter Mla subunit MlaD
VNWSTLIPWAVTTTAAVLFFFVRSTADDKARTMTEALATRVMEKIDNLGKLIAELTTASRLAEDRMARVQQDQERHAARLDVLERVLLERHSA